MAGHSKWKNIRLHKGKADKERAKLFAKLSRDLTVAAKSGGDVDSNPRLRLAYDKARAGSMPAENIKRAIQKGTGELASDNHEEITYEGYGPGGVAILVETETDNRNRTVAAVRSLFNKNGGSLGEGGSVAWQFQRLGQITVAARAENGAPTGEDTLFEAALEAGATDIASDGGGDEDGFVVTTPLELLDAVERALEEAGFPIESADSAFVPDTVIEVAGEDARRVLRLLEALEDDDDVTGVVSNADWGETEMDAD